MCFMNLSNLLYVVPEVGSKLPVITSQYVPEVTDVCFYLNIGFAYYEGQHAIDFWCSIVLEEVANGHENKIRDGSAQAR